MRLFKPDADGAGEVDVLAGVGQLACFGVDGKDLYAVAVAAGAEQEASVGRDGEVARMASCGLVASIFQQPSLGVDAEDGESVAAQTVGGVEEAAVGRQVDVGASAALEIVAAHGLLLGEMSVAVGKHNYIARQFGDEVGVAAVGVEGDVARA